MPYFTCLRCNYETNHKSSMYVHLTKNIKCSPNIESLKYSDDELIKHSLLNSNDKYNFNYNFKVNKTTQEFIEDLKNIYKNKERICNYCQKNFSKFKDLEKHLFECVQIMNDSKNNKDCNKEGIKDCIKEGIKDVDAHANKDTSSNLYINNLNINFDTLNNDIKFDKINKDIIIPFNSDWITLHINNSTKTLIFLSKSKFSKTFEYILQNNINKNIFINKNPQYIFVYKNVNEKFKKYKTDEIIDDIMKKLYNHLLDFYDDIKKNNIFQIDNDIIKDSLKNIKNKFINFKKDNLIRKNVSLLLISIIQKYIKNNIELSNNSNFLY